MKEILVLSGKGGTGKTTVAAALICMIPDCIIADCDVDAPDLHLLLSPEVKEEHEFISGVNAGADSDKCTACGICRDVCAFEAVTMCEKGYAEMDEFACEGCGVCAWFCPEDAIVLEDNHCGSWFISETEWGPMVHAKLNPGEENSGRLVALVKRRTAELAERREKKWVVVDGPPGIGCPVIASMSGSDIIVAVTEPTGSGLHDLKRLSDLAEHFKIPLSVCINKWDLNIEKTEEITAWCREKGVSVAGRIGFSEDVVRAMLAGQPVVTMSGPVSVEMEELWQNIKRQLA